jgi:type VI secretion system secreted protein VgrG
MMKSSRIFLPLFSAAATIFFLAPPAWAQLLGIAGSYGALSASTVTNTGNTVITGSLGVSPGLAITGFSAVDGGPGLFTGALNQGNAAAVQAQADLAAAYVALAGMGFTANLSGTNLGGLTLTPGVYFFSSSADLTGTLTLDAQGDSNARFVFQIGSTFTTAANSMVNIIHLSPSAECGPESGIYWQVGSSATVGVNSAIAGNILALASVTLDSGASIDFGRALALTGAVTLDNNRIDASDADGGLCAPIVSDFVPVPEASTYGLFGSCALVFAVWFRRTQSGRSHLRSL